LLTTISIEIGEDQLTATDVKKF